MERANGWSYSVCVNDYLRCDLLLWHEYHPKDDGDIQERYATMDGCELSTLLPWTVFFREDTFPIIIF